MNDDEMLTLWVGAFRYYCGRMTYATGSFASMLIWAWPTLPERTRFLIQRDLEEAFGRDDDIRALGESSIGYPLGMDCDRAEWERVRALWR